MMRTRLLFAFLVFGLAAAGAADAATTLQSTIQCAAKQCATSDLSDINTFSLNTSGTIKTTNTTASTSTTTGATVVTGGLGVGGSIFGGANIVASTGSLLIGGATGIGGLAALGIVCNDGGGSFPPLQNTGMYLCTNLSGGLGEVNFWNTQQSGNGFNWQQMTAINTATQVMAVSGTGLITARGGFVAGGSLPTPTGTCAINTQLGGNTAGSFKANGACAGGTVILTFSTTAPNGWVCEAHDLTTTADALNQTAYSTTSCTFTGTMASLDLVTFSAVGF